MKRFGLLVAVVVSGLLFAACGSSSSNSSGDVTTTSVTSAQPSTTTSTAPPKADIGDLKTYLNKLFAMRSNDQQGPAWDLLVPQQQELIPRTKFLTCGGMSASVTDVSISIVGDPYSEETEIPGVAGTVDSTAVTVRMTAKIRGKESTENLTLHVVDVGGQWRWILSPDAVQKCS